MTITRQADYAVRAVIHLAGQGVGAQLSTAEIARSQNIPSSFLAKIVSRLSVAGVLHATRGAHGGVSLARPAETISLLEVVEAIDGPFTLNQCVVEPTSCSLVANCVVWDVWCQAQAELVDRLKGTTVGQLLNGRAKAPAVPAPNGQSA